MKSQRIFGVLLIAAGSALAQEQPGTLSSVFGTESAVDPLAAATATAAFQYVVAHFPYGAGWGTRVMMNNTGGSAATAKLTFLNQMGASTSVPLAGSGAKSTETFTIKPNDVATFAADSSTRTQPALTVAWAMLSSNQPLNVFSLFDFGPNPPAISGAVGAQSTPASTSWVFPVSINGPVGFNAGMAIANANSSSTKVTITVFDANGNKKASVTDDLLANNQEIFTLTQKFPGSFSSALFTGSVAVCATQPIGLVTVGFEGGQAFFTTSVANPKTCP